jgi:hypothetical protein
VERVKEVSVSQRANVYKNTTKNKEILLHYMRLAVETAHMKAWDDVRAIRSRWERMEACNLFWEVETYEASRVKLLLRTYLCHDKFCVNCKQLKRLVMRNRFIPYMRQFSHAMYHVTLTVPNCTGEELPDTLRRMAACFKTLVSYLNGNRKISGLDFVGYGFQGCIRSLEITYSGDEYHPHYHVAAVFDNPAVVDDKCISNKFSMSGKRLFSELEAIIQRVWWLLINGQRLSYKNVTAASGEHDRYSCTVDCFHPDDYGVLFSYMTKIRSEENELMEYHQFVTLYHALNRVRQIQGYGVFYRVPAAEDDPQYTEDEYRDIEDYIFPGEQPNAPKREHVKRLSNDTGHTMIMYKRRDKKR